MNMNKVIGTLCRPLLPILFLCIPLCNFYTKVCVAQDLSLVGHRTDVRNIFNAISLGDSIADVAADKWSRIGDYQYFSALIRISTDSAFWSLTGLDTGRIEIRFEEWDSLSTSGKVTVPTDSSLGYINADSTSRSLMMAITSVDTGKVTKNTKQIQLIKSFHSSGSPSLLLSNWVRFYYTVFDTLSGISLSMDLVKQP